jgi:hypothetical protein
MTSKPNPNPNSFLKAFDIVKNLFSSHKQEDKENMRRIFTNWTSLIDFILASVKFLIEKLLKLFQISGTIFTESIKGLAPAIVIGIQLLSFFIFICIVIFDTMVLLGAKSTIPRAFNREEDYVFMMLFNMLMGKNPTNTKENSVLQNSKINQTMPESEQMNHYDSIPTSQSVFGSGFWNSLLKYTTPPSSQIIVDRTPLESGRCNNMTDLETSILYSNPTNECVNIFKPSDIEWQTNFEDNQSYQKLHPKVQEVLKSHPNYMHSEKQTIKIPYKLHQKGEFFSPSCNDAYYEINGKKVLANILKDATDGDEEFCIYNEIDKKKHNSTERVVGNKINNFQL